MLNREYRKELLRKYARSPEDDRLLARLVDKYEAWQRSGLQQATRFLTERDLLCALPLLRELGADPIPWGGYCEAERRVLIFPADWQDGDAVCHGDDCPLTVLEAAFRAEDAPGHRDVLGALMGLGVERDTIGDIVLHDAACHIVLTREVAPFVLENLRSAGRTALKLSVIPEAEAQEAAYRLIRDTVASLRLDAVVGSGFGLAREKAANAIRTGKVAVDGLECLKPDRAVEQGARISLRGLGKLQLQEVGGLSKKGRTTIVIRRFI